MEAHNIFSSAIVAQVLTGKDNYENWRACIKNYLWVRDLWDIVEQTSELPQQEEGDGADFKAWRKRNVSALHAIQISCDPIMLSHIRNMTTAKDAWNTLAQVCQLPMAQDAPQITEDAPQITEDAPQIVEDAPQIPVARDADSTHISKLLKAIEENDLLFAKSLLTSHPHSANAVVGDSRFTALHFTIFKGQLDMVEEFLCTMSKEHLKMRDRYGCTVLHHAAVSENTKIAQSLIRKNRELLTFPDNKGDIPLNYACFVGHKDMTHYLYNMTSREFLLSRENERPAAWFVCQCITNKWFDVALDLLRRCPHLIFVKRRDGMNAVTVLSCQPSAFPSGSGLSFWQRWIYSCLKVKLSEYLSSENDVYINIYKPQNQKKKENFLTQGIKQIYDLKVTHAYALELLRMMSMTIATSDVAQFHQSSVHQAMLKAAQQGVIEFIVEVIKPNLDLLMFLDQEQRSIFHIAVAHRQEIVFSLLYGPDTTKYLSLPYADADGNNMLHWVGQLPPQSLAKLGQISGAALQMQRELQWFKVVESIVHPMCKEYRNNRGETPYEVFDRSHAQLVKEGEKWMKVVAQSSSVVGTLIITIMFAALFTVPGGPNQDTGVPILLTNKPFKVFVISDAISLCASTTSVLIFLGILTSRYRTDDFLESLPNKLIIGLSSLFISIAAMMVAFSSTVFIMLKGQLEIVIPIVVLVSFPIGLFAWLEFPLLADFWFSTFRPGIFVRKMKQCL